MVIYGRRINITTRDSLAVGKFYGRGLIYYSRIAQPSMITQSNKTIKSSTLSKNSGRYMSGYTLTQLLMKYHSGVEIMRDISTYQIQIAYAYKATS